MSSQETPNQVTVVRVRNFTSGDIFLIALGDTCEMWRVQSDVCAGDVVTAPRYIRTYLRCDKESPITTRKGYTLLLLPVKDKLRRHSRPRLKSIVLNLCARFAILKWVRNSSIQNLILG